MSKYLVTTSTDVIRYVSYIVEADSREEAESNWEEGEIEDEWYEDSGKIYTEEIYPELFNNLHAKITMVGKIDISIIQDLIKENNLINTLYWY